jgi:hypothetical protein
MPYFHSSMEQPGGVGHCIGTVLQFPAVMADWQQKAAPSSEEHWLPACTPITFAKEWGSATRAAEPAGIGRDALPQNVGGHVLSHLLWWPVHSSHPSRLTLITHQTQQLPVRPPHLFLFAEFSYFTQAVV